MKRGVAGVEQVLLQVMLLGLDRRGGNRLDLLFDVYDVHDVLNLDAYISCNISLMLWT